MLFRLFCFFLLFFSLAFAAYEKELSRFDSTFTSSKDKQSLYLELKNFYIQSIINEDEKSKIELLKRLVIGANALNLDSSEYEKELKNAGFKDEYIQSLKNAYKKDSEQDFLKKQEYDEAKNSNNQKKENEKITQKPFVLKASKLENGVKLSLNFNLNKKDIKKSILKQKDNVRYIFDFNAALDTGALSFKFKDFFINIAQFNPKITRLVINAKEESAYNLKLEDKSLILIFDENLKEAKNPSIQNKENLKETKNSNTLKENSQTNSKENLEKNSTNSTKKLYILSSKSSEMGVVLSLNRDLDEDELKIVSFKDKNLYRKILSFEGVLEGGRKNFTLNKKFITLTQYTPKIVRVVLSSPDDFELFKDLENKRAFFGFEKSSNLSSKNQTNSSKNTKAAQNTTKTSSKSTQKSAQRPANLAKNKIIVIDAGHGGKDVGAINGKLYEKNIVLNVSLKLGKELERLGYKVFYTRNKDKFINLRDRTKLANDKKANLFISIHANAAPNKAKADSMQGVETFFLSPARSERSKQVAEKENQADFEEANFFLKQNFLSALSREKIIASNRLAIDIQKNLLESVRKRYKVIDGAVREAPFWVLVGAQDMPAVLIEIGYITHPEESKRLANNIYQQLLAEGIANGVQNYFINNP